jgi:hypothetical protein
VGKQILDRADAAARAAGFERVAVTTLRYLL